MQTGKTNKMEDFYKLSYMRGVTQAFLDAGIKVANPVNLGKVKAVENSSMPNNPGLEIGGDVQQSISARNLVEEAAEDYPSRFDDTKTLDQIGEAISSLRSGAQVAKK